MNEDYISYAFMFIIYSGLGSWLVSRFTRDQTEVRRERRRAVRENLELMEKMSQLRNQITNNERRTGLEAMWSRLLDETTARIDELNANVAEERRNPARGFLILPPPRTPFAVFASLIFAGAAYIGIGMLLVIGFAYFQDSNFTPATDTADRQWMIKLLGLSAAGVLLAFAARLLAYRLYNQHARGAHVERVATD